MHSHRNEPQSGIGGLAILGCIGLGAVLMYFFDPDAGRRRRDLVREKYLNARVQLQDATEAAVHAAANRTREAIGKAQQRLTPKEIAVNDTARDAGNPAEPSGT